MRGTKTLGLNRVKVEITSWILKISSIEKVRSKKESNSLSWWSKKKSNNLSWIRKEERGREEKGWRRSNCRRITKVVNAKKNARVRRIKALERVRDAKMKIKCFQTNAVKTIVPYNSMLIKKEFHEAK